MKIWIDILILWGTFLAVMVTVIVVFVGYRLYQEKRLSDRFVKDTEKQLQDLQSRYNLAVLRPPEEILERARTGAESLVNNTNYLIDRLGMEVSQLRTELNLLKAPSIAASSPAPPSSATSDSPDGDGI